MTILAVVRGIGHIICPITSLKIPPLRPHWIPAMNGSRQDLGFKGATSPPKVKPHPILPFVPQTPR